MQRDHFGLRGLGVVLAAVVMAFAAQSNAMTWDVVANGPIPPGAPAVSLGTSTFNFNVAGEGNLIVDIDLQLAISHAAMSDLAISLKSPAGTVVDVALATTLGGTAMQDTMVDDGGGTALAAGAPPYVGIFTPAGSFGDFNNENPNGSWELTVEDTFVIDTGFLYAPGDSAPWGTAVGTRLMVNARSLDGAAIPEPVSATLGLIGLAAIGLTASRRRSV